MDQHPCESLPITPKLRMLLRVEEELRRDLDYMRDLLLELEASSEWQHALGLDSEDDPVRDYHVELLCDEGLLSLIQPGIYRMTGRAHDFLDHTRDQTIWNKSKEAVSHLKGHSIGMLIRVAEGYVRARLREVTGFDV